MKTIYAILVIFPDHTSAVSTQGFESLDDAKNFIAERTDEQFGNGWHGIDHMGHKQDCIYKIREIQVQENK